MGLIIALRLLGLLQSLWTVRVEAQYINGVYDNDADAHTPCTRSDCSDHGECIGTKENPKCYCHVPYTGDDCADVQCDASDCYDHGYCTGTKDYPKCQCFPGYGGVRCEEGAYDGSSQLGNSGFPMIGGPVPERPRCDIAQCSYHGICYRLGGYGGGGFPGQNFECTCAAGFTGPTCATPLPPLSGPGPTAGPGGVIKSLFGGVLQSLLAPRVNYVPAVPVTYVLARGKK